MSVDVIEAHRAVVRQKRRCVEATSHVDDGCLRMCLEERLHLDEDVAASDYALERAKLPRERVSPVVDSARVKVESGQGIACVWVLQDGRIELASEHAAIEGNDKRLLYRVLLNAGFLHGCTAPLVKLMA